MKRLVLAVAVAAVLAGYVSSVHLSFAQAESPEWLEKADMAMGRITKTLGVCIPTGVARR